MQPSPKQRRSFDPSSQALTQTAPPRVLDAANIIETVAEYFGVETQRLAGTGRDRQAALARHVAAYLIREETGRSFATIGRDIGGRDHSAILRAHAKIDQQVNAGLAVREDVLEIRKRLHIEGPY